MALCGELALEEAMDSYDRLLMMMMMMTTTTTTTTTMGGQALTYGGDESYSEVKMSSHSAKKV
jgi:hypothetical protein